MNSTSCELMNATQSAHYIGISPRTLQMWRCTNRRSIPFIKVGSLVKYRKEDLDKFLDQQRIDKSIESETLTKETK